MAGRHTAGSTFLARENFGRWAAEQIVEVINGQRLVAVCRTLRETAAAGPGGG